MPLPTEDAPRLSNDWLELRRDADSRARTESTDALLKALAMPGNHHRSAALDAVDLGTGSGSNVLYLAPKLAAAGVHKQRWILVDKDPDLLALVVEQLQHATTELQDELSSHLEIDARTCAIDMATDMDEVPMNGAHLVTGSALLDVVSAHWVTDLSSRLEGGRVGAALMSMTIDGHVLWSPEEPPLDGKMMEAFHGRMSQDKGFGPALGVNAITHFGRAMVARGNTVQCFDASWILDDLDTELQERYLDRIVGSLRGTDAEAQGLEEWFERRRRWIDTDESDLVVGHYDVLALRAPV